MWHLARMKSCFSSSDRSLGRAWWLFVRRSVPPTRSPCLGSSNPFPPSDPVKREGASRFRGDSSRIHKWLIFDATVIMVGWYHPCQLHGNYIQYLVITYNGKASAKEHTHTQPKCWFKFFCNTLWSKLFGQPNTLCNCIALFYTWN